MGRFFLSGNAGRPQSRGEEIANAASHGAALAAAVVAGYWLVAWGRSRFRGGAGLGSASFYGQSALLMAFIDHALVVITFNGRAPVI